jgi:hypothetical protein
MQLTFSQDHRVHAANVRAPRSVLPLSLWADWGPGTLASHVVDKSIRSMASWIVAVPPKAITHNPIKINKALSAITC